MLKPENELLESLAYPGFYHHPEIESIIISRDGLAVDLRGRVCPLETLSRGYPSVNIRGRGSFRVHRLLAEVFIQIPSTLDNPIVNHLDGVKTNNRLDNLEWTDHSGNIIHAYATGLRTDNRPLLLKNLVDGTLTRFNSLQEAAKHFKVNGAEVYRYLNNDALVPWKKRYELVYEGDAWRGLTGDDLNKVNNGQSKEVVAFTQDTVIIFSSIADVSRTLGISLFKLYGALASGKSANGVAVKYLEECDEHTLIDAKRPQGHKSTVVRPNFKRSPVPIVVTDLSTGEETHWASCEEFARIYGVTKSAIQRSLGINDGRWRQFKVKYAK